MATFFEISTLNNFFKFRNIFSVVFLKFSSYFVKIFIYFHFLKITIKFSQKQETILNLPEAIRNLATPLVTPRLTDRVFVTPMATPLSVRPGFFSIIICTRTS